MPMWQRRLLYGSLMCPIITIMIPPTPMHAITMGLGVTVPSTTVLIPHSHSATLGEWASHVPIFLSLFPLLPIQQLVLQIAQLCQTPQIVQQ